MEMFTQSLDWGNEILASLVWVAKGWVIAAAVLLVVLVLIARHTVWGRQFWRVSGGYFVGRQSIPVWVLLGVLLLSVMVSVRMDVLFSYYANDQATALQVAFEGAGAGDDAVRDSGIAGFWKSIVIFGLLVAADITRTLLDLYLMQYFIIRWRVWLTDRLTGDWLDDRAYYRGRFLGTFDGEPVDNPDQRIQTDIDIFTTGTGPETNTPTVATSQTLLFGSVYSIISVVAFTPILWNLAGPLTILGVTVPKALFWIALLWVAVTTVIAFWIGRPIIRLTFRNELTNAAFRYALVRIRDAAEAVSFYRGERTERATLATRFARIITNYRRLVLRGVAFLGWNRSINQIIEPLPLIVQAPRLFAGELQLGDVTQSSGAFARVQSSLSFFRSVYDAFAGYRAAIIRLDGLLTANEQARALPRLEAGLSADGGVELEGLEVRSPSGDVLLDDLDMRLTPGDWLVITGSSGTGKTTMLRSLAQLWPYSAGTVRFPGHTDPLAGTGPGTDRYSVMFLSQLPYAPLGDLRSVVSYPSPPDTFDDTTIRAALDAVTLGHLGSRLDTVADWAKVLSPGEQQRIAFARILLARPRAVFLDEATSALDAGQEFALYSALRSQLPETIVVSVSHRDSVNRHHDRRLALLGDGRWELTAVPDGAGQS
ncbi:ABC transporter ATP-binding protein/permease [Mycolicibacterium goodii]|uniref:Multidrug ABC transporter ATP-binding protein n=1 Tax=Mycolicibacterium goodii TaxID=134601 RepID=A0A0K0X9K2_MYCGD|nr:multidrug ABC transporter ATP-binding protein [Mycolicibacterium goodii]